MSKSWQFLPVDQESESIQVGTAILTQDASETPKASPYSLTTTETAFTVPSNAAVLVAWSSGAWRISESSAMTRHAVVAANQIVSIPLGRTDTIYLRGDSGTVTLNFYFITV